MVLDNYSEALEKGDLKEVLEFYKSIGYYSLYVIPFDL